MKFGVWDSLGTRNLIFSLTAHIVDLLTKFKFQYVNDLLYCVQVAYCTGRSTNKNLIYIKNQLQSIKLQ